MQQKGLGVSCNWCCRNSPRIASKKQQGAASIIFHKHMQLCLNFTLID